MLQRLDKKNFIKSVLTILTSTVILLSFQFLTVYGADNKIPVYGDADNDRILTASDAAMILQKALISMYKTELEKIDPDYVVYLDVDNDGKLTASDAAIVLQKALKSTYRMPVEEQTNKGGDTMKLFVEENELSIKWEDNESVKALKELVKDKPLTIQMSMYGGFEQVGSLGTSLPRNDVQITTSAGDIVLYSGNQIVIFYGSNSWAYTKLGKVENTSAKEMKALLGNGNVTIKLLME